MRGSGDIGCVFDIERVIHCLIPLVHSIRGFR